MPKANSIQSSWTKGEISPLAAGRVDVSLYASGAKTIENLIVRPQGPLFRRSGTKFVNATRVPSDESVTVPFEVSDEQAYELEFGKGYIRFFKSKEPIFDSVDYAVDALTATDNGGLMQLSARTFSTFPVSVGDDFGDIPTFDIVSVSPYFSTTDKYQITTSIPHTLRVGSKALIIGTGLSNLGGAITAIGSGTGGVVRVTVTSSDTVFTTTGVMAITGSIDTPSANGIWNVTRVSGNIYDLVGSVYGGSVGGALGDWARGVTITEVTPRSFVFSVNTILGTSASGFVATTGLIAGDKFKVGTSNSASISDRYLIVKSVEFPHKWTVANVDDAAGSPTGKAYTIPVEIETNYGYGKTISVTSATDSGAGFIRITTAIPHGYSDGNTVVINGAGRGVDGQWTINVQSTTTFDLVESVWYGTTGSTGTGTVKLNPGSASFSIKDLKYAQSADVLFLTHPLYPPSKLIRLDDDGDRNDWLFTEAQFRDGPYMGMNDLAPNINSTTPQDGAVYPDVYFQTSSYTHTAIVKSLTVFDNADDDKYIEYKEGNQWRLAKLGTMAGGETTTTVTVMDNVMLGVDETTILNRQRIINYVPGTTVSSPSRYYGYGARGKASPAGYYSLSGAYLGRIDPGNELASDEGVAGGVIASGTITSQYSNTFSASDVGKFVRIKSSARTAAGYWVQITQVGTGTGGPESTSNKAQHGASVAMASNNETGKFVVTQHIRAATLTAKKAAAAFSAFSASDIGRMVRLGYAGRWTWGKISNYTSASVVTLTMYEDMPRDPADATRVAGNQEGMKADGTLTTADLTTGITYDWRMGSWSDTTGYPACVVFHEQRLTFAATFVEPQTFWMSTSGDFENMAPTELDSTVLDDSAIAYELASAKANPIRWLVSGSALGVGTAGGEWQVKAATSINDPITPSSISAKEFTTHGAGSRVQPAKVGSSVLFVDRSKEKVHELFYSYQDDAVVSDELSIISEHILRVHGGAVAAAFQQKPHSVYWIACADGTLSAVTFNKKQEVTAWHHHTIAGALVEWISTIPSDDGTEDELWMVCARTVNGSTFRTIEVMESDFYPASASSRAGMRFQDGHIAVVADTFFTGTVITGLNWLIGQDVTVTADGVRLTGTYTVNSSGEITLAANTYDEILVGVNGNADMESLPPEGGSAFGTSQGQVKRVIDLDMRFMNTMNVSFGPNSSTLTSKTLVPSTGIWFTGTDRLVPRSNWGVENQYFIRQSDPYPLNILFVVAKLETSE